MDWFRFGLVTQRPRAYEAEHETQRGLLAGFSYKAVGLTTHVFGLDDTKPTVVVAIGLSF